MLKGLIASVASEIFSGAMSGLEKHHDAVVHVQCLFSCFGFCEPSH